MIYNMDNSKTNTDSITLHIVDHSTFQAYTLKIKYGQLTSDSIELRDSSGNIIECQSFNFDCIKELFTATIVIGGVTKALPIIGITQ